MNALFLSLRPLYADLILSGRKSVEVRRVIPREASEESLVLIYAASPEKALVGFCFLDRITSGRPDAMWRKCGQGTGLSKKDYFSYLDGATQAVALHVSRPVPFSRRIELFQIRRVWDEFRPPQSFSYVPVKALETLARSVPRLGRQETASSA